MYILIGDIGNTVTKICSLDNKSFKIKKIVYFKSNDLLLKKKLLINFKKIIKGDNFDKNALFSSVVPKYELALKKFLYKVYKIKLKEIKEKKIVKSIKVNIKNKKQVGSDRLANAIGVYKKYKKNFIIVDFGTATTFDVIKKPGIYDGGVIAPGINLSIETLFSSTALLPMFKLKNYPHAYGKNTKEALNSGFFWGYQGLINNIVRKITKKNGKNFKIILTGGYSNLFKNKIDKKTKVEHDITIQGIIKIYKKFLI